MRVKQFRDIISNSGIFYNSSTREDGSYSTAWVDFNQDGWSDLIVSTHWWQPRRNELKIYINQQDGTFVDIAPAVKTDYFQINVDTHGMSWADFDNDGDKDVFVASGGPTESVFYENIDGQLVERAEQYGVAGFLGKEKYDDHNRGLRLQERGRGAFWYDWDNDGRLDLLQNNLIINLGRVISESVKSVNEEDKQRKIHFVNEGLDQTSLYLQRNNRFQFVKDFGNQRIYSWVNGVSNLYGNNSDDFVFIENNKNLQIYEKQSNQKLEPILEVPGTSRESITSFDLEDYDGDTFIDILVLRKNTRNSQPMTPILLIYDPETNSYLDKTQESGLNQPIFAADVVSEDFDNDGDRDLYITTSGKVGLTSRLWENDGNAGFTEVSEAGGAKVVTKGKSTGTLLDSHPIIATADLNNDGFIDMFTSNIISKPAIEEVGYHLFLNRGNQNNWLQIDLQGTQSNRDGVGARVYVTTDNGKTQIQENFGGMHGYGQNHSRLHFGLNKQEKADITVQWPSGIEQKVLNVKANQVIEIIESRKSPNPPKVNNRIIGTSGHDTLTGNNFNNYINGLAGKDSLVGKEGDDTLIGGSEKDQLDGGNNNDLLRGNQGNDRLLGEAGNDTLEGGSDNDFLEGGKNDDLLKGDQGNDRLFGEAGNDTLEGGSDNDFLNGGKNDDLLKGDQGNDRLLGEAGNDTLEGGSDNDFLNGGNNNDLLKGDQGNDRLFGEAGNDTLEGGDGEDQLVGGGGNDLLIGNKGNDRLFGEENSDTLEGGEGDDRLAGGGGHDLLIGNQGNDFIIGSQGRDTLVGGEGIDTLLGSEGSDIFLFNSPQEAQDIITGFSNQDLIFVSRANFSSRLSLGTLSSDNLVIGTTATENKPQFLYDNKQQQLFFDANGTNAGNVFLILQFKGSAKDFTHQSIQVV